MTEPVSAIPTLMTILRAGSVWFFGAMTLAGLTFIFAPSPEGIDLTGLRTEFGPRVYIGTAVSAALTFARALELYFQKKTETAKRVEIFLILVKNIHEKLITYGSLDNPDYVSECLVRLEQSEDGIWVKDNLRGARNIFIEHARKALHVRRAHGDYRCEIERAETTTYLDNSKERLVAVLQRKKAPQLFDPYADCDPPWWQRFWLRATRSNGWPR